MNTNPFDIYTEEYEEWFKENESVFHSELEALKKVIPMGKKGLEIGIGSGIFAEQLGIEYGIDPSENMLQYARERKLIVQEGVAENLPYPDKSFDFAVFITSICFIDNPSKAFKEAYRVVKDKGSVIVAIIDKDSSLGQTLAANKEDSRFYRTASFYSVPKVMLLLETNNFEVTHIFQTLVKPGNKEVEKPIEGYGKGGFVVIKGKKN
ncbi:MAG: class I SAM-dependent methyltransferase [Balneolaceae bacterium]